MSDHDVPPNAHNDASVERSLAFVRFHVGDALTVMRSMPDVSVDLVLTSPPFFGLRSYLPPNDPAKSQEMGSEATPGECIDALLEIVEECRRVLAPHGSIAFELGDTYAGSGSGGNAKFRPGYVRNDRDDRTPDPGPKDSRRLRPTRGGHSRRDDEAAGIISHSNGWKAERAGWPLDKSLCLVPELFRFALVYGFNPLTGRETPRWRARNVVRWCRPNPPVGALSDKFRPATSDLLIACVGRKRYFDLDVVRVPFSGNHGVGTGVRKGQKGEKPEDGRPNDMPLRLNTHDGAPPLDWWEISTQPYSGSHYATWPEALCERPIRAMCPVRVCTVCGKPSERISDVTYEPNRSSNGPQSIERMHLDGGSAGFAVRADRVSKGSGWTDCGHAAWRSGVVLDPFAGSGSTLAVAHGHGRSAIGIDLDARNAELARARVGMFLDEVVT